MQLLVSQLLAYRTVYNHPRDAFLLPWICNCRYGLQSSKGCVPSALDVQLSVRFTIIQRMRVFYSKHSVVSLPVIGLLLQSFQGCVSPTLSMQLWVWFSIIQGMLFCCTEYAVMRFSYTKHAVVGFRVISLPVVGLPNDLQSFQGCVSPILSMQLTVSRSLAYWKLYNHPRNAYAMVVIGLQVVGISDGLQLSKDAFLPH